MALLLEFDPENDRIIFDVGHQSYTWKILTGRLDRFFTLRKKRGCPDSQNAVKVPLIALIPAIAALRSRLLSD